MLAEDAVVLHAFDAGGAGAGYGLVVDDFILQPEIRNAEPDHVVHDGGHMFGGAEDIHQVDSAARLLARRGLRSVEVG